MRLKWQYMVTTPWPWSTKTVWPLKKKSPASSTRPVAGLATTAPDGAAMSIPLCGLRDWPLKTRRSPNELERGPSDRCGPAPGRRERRRVCAERALDARAFGVDAFHVFRRGVDVARIHREALFVVRLRGHLERQRRVRVVQSRCHEPCLLRAGGRIEGDAHDSDPTRLGAHDGRAVLAEIDRARCLVASRGKIEQGEAAWHARVGWQRESRGYARLDWQVARRFRARHRGSRKQRAPAQGQAGRDESSGHAERCRAAAPPRHQRSSARGVAGSTSSTLARRLPWARRASITVPGAACVARCNTRPVASVTIA